MKKNILFISLSLLIFSYTCISSLNVEQIKIASIINNLLTCIALFQSFRWVFYDLSVVKSENLSNNQISQPYYYIRNSKIKGMNIADILGTLPSSLYLTFLFALPFLSLNKFVFEYLILVEAFILLLIFILIITAIYCYPYFSNHDSLCALTIIATKLILISLNISLNTLFDNYHYILYILSGYAIVNIAFFILLKSIINLKKANIMYEKLLPSHKPGRNNYDGLLSGIKQKPNLNLLNKELSFNILNSRSKINIVAIFNLFCVRTNESIMEIRQILCDSSGDVSFQALFNIHIYRDDIQKNIIKALIKKQEEGKDIFLILNKCHKNKSKFLELEKEGQSLKSTSYENKITHHINWARKHKIVEGPSFFINGHRILPNSNLRQIIFDLLSSK